VGVSNSLLESPDQSLKTVQAKCVASASPQKNISYRLLSSLESLLAFTVANVLLQNTKSSKRLCGLETTRYDELVAAFQSPQALRVTLPSDDVPGTKQSCVKNALQVSVIV
jgi:hypothetical protein